MPTYHQIQQRLQADDDLVAFLTRKELKELPRLMFKDEEIENIVYGHYRGCNGIIVMSNARLIFADKGVHAFTTEVIDLTQVKAMEQSFSGKFGTLSFTLPKKTVLLEYLDQKTFDTLTAWLKSKMSAPGQIAQLEREVSQEEKPLEGADQEFAAKMERLTRLRDRGLISEDEFQEQRRRLLEDEF